jgi:hypothetical protein
MAPSVSTNFAIHDPPRQANANHVQVLLLKSPPGFSRQAGLLDKVSTLCLILAQTLAPNARGTAQCLRHTTKK